MSNTINHATVSFRILDRWMDDAGFQALLDTFDERPGMTDEITFFTADTHPPLTLEAFRERMKVLRERMREVRSRGYRAGVNLLATIGHHEEHLPHSLSGPYTYVTDIKGNTCKGSFCPNDLNFQSYIREIYRLAALAEPDYIWIDDDVRLRGHMPLDCTCFCDTCLRLFSESLGEGGTWTREALHEAFNGVDRERKIRLRKAWLGHNRRTIASLFALIQDTVHSIHPGLPIGFMTGERFYEGYDFAGWEAVLSGGGESPVLWRPGGGFYSDDRPRELAAKSHEIGRQVSLLPERVLSIQSEIENFPYQRLKKSSQITVLEAAAHMAAGCTGAAFNVMSLFGESATEYLPLLNRIHEARPFYDLLASKLGRSRPIGVGAGWSMDGHAIHHLQGGDWLQGYAGGITGQQALELYELGLPPAYELSCSRVTLLAGAGVRGIGRPDLEKALSGAAYLDAEALEHLLEMGYGEWVGFAPERTVTADGVETFSFHPLQPGLEGRRRDCRQSFWFTPAVPLRPTAQGAQILSRLTDYTGKETASCVMGIYENRQGGRICVSGYYPWTSLQNFAKSSQLKSLFRWLSRDTLPAYAASYHKCNLWARMTVDNRLGLVIMNSGFDTAEPIEIVLRTRSEQVRTVGLNGEERLLGTEPFDDAYSLLRIPRLEGWDILWAECLNDTES